MKEAIVTTPYSDFSEEENSTIQLTKVSRVKLYYLTYFGTFGVWEDDERRRRDERKYGKMPQGKFAHY